MNTKPVCFYLITDNTEKTKIEDINNITLEELAEGYVDNSETEEGGVWGWKGKLNIRPKFQRSYVVDADEKWKTELIHSVLNGLPTGVIYLGLANDKDGNSTYINIDGQQRLMTLLSYINNELSLKMRSDDGSYKEVVFNQLPEDWKNRIKNYCLAIKKVTGSESSLLKWFQTINQPVCILSTQELRNAAYNGEFVEAIKRIFAKTRAFAKPTFYNGQYINPDSKYFYERYSNGVDPVRQDLVEFVLDWVSYRDYKNFKDMSKDDRIESYMYVHRNDNNANDAENYYKSVIDWVLDVFFHGNTFPKNKKDWKSICIQDWNVMYEKYHTNSYTDEQKKHITKKCNEYLKDAGMKYNKTIGVYEWVLRGEKKEEESTYLRLRGFNKDDIMNMYYLQNGIDPIDGKHYDMDELEAHHIVSFRSGGLPIKDNMVLITKENHSRLHSDNTMTAEDLKNKRNAIIKSNGHSLI